MPSIDSTPNRFIGLDIHKHYFVAIGVDHQLNQIFGPHQADIHHIEQWAEKNLTKQDAVVVEMTTNTYSVYDALLPLVHSVTVVHPPHVALIVRAQVKTDKKAALSLAQLHAAGLLPSVWIPPVEIRQLRALIAHRRKMVRLVGTAKNRLHAFLQRHRIQPPGDFSLFDPMLKDWWKAQPAAEIEKIVVQSDLETLEFAQQQVEKLDQRINEIAAKNETVPLLIQLPGIGPLTALTIIAAVGNITRFSSAKKLVGYAGLGARVHDSGMAYTTGRITKAGRRDLRRAMVDAANHAVDKNPFWRAQYQQLEKRLGRSKAIVAIARKLLVAVWHIWSKEVADRHADPVKVARSYFGFVYKTGVRNLPEKQTALGFTRKQLDRIGIGIDLKEIPWGSKRFKLPPSQLRK